MSKSVKDVLKEKYGITRPIKKIKGSFDIYDANNGTNNITSLEGCPYEVYGNVSIMNINLETLEGCTQKVGGSFEVKDCKLESLKGGPKSVEYWYSCIYNNLTSLEGAPKVVDTDFDCSYNNLTSLEGIPSHIYGDFKCKKQKNKVFTVEEIEEKSKITGRIYNE